MAEKMLMLANGNVWRKGKLYMPEKAWKKSSLKDTVDNFTFKGVKYYTADKVRRVKGLAPRNLL